ncbi:MAG: hypothetical protein Q7V01_03695 [Vicinamibacterales bacterium]|nr:hypothetical protein [Vicinamibacterales bacterium]
MGDRLRAWYERLVYPPARPATALSPGRRAFCPGVPFVTGTNLPWLTYGCDVGASAWRPGGGIAAPATRAVLEEHLARIAGDGHRIIRWFLLCDGRSGIRVAAGGAPAGLDDRVRFDLDAAANALARHGIEAIFVVFDYLLCAPPRVAGGVQTGGRRLWLARAAFTAPLIERVVSPLVAHLGPDAPVAAWDLINEPEWITRGFGGGAATGAVSRGAMRRFLEDAVAAVHEAADVPVTVGLASTRGLDMVRDLGLDVYQVHWYDRHSSLAQLDTSVADWRLDAPLVLGEYPTRGSRLAAADIVATARRSGYAGALGWSTLSGDEASAGSGPEV